MSYSQNLPTSKTTPFALLTRSSYQSGDAQWDTRSQSWVSTSNTWAGKALVFGAPTCLASGYQIIASAKFTSESGDRYTYSNHWSNDGETRVSQDDVMISYGSDATWATDTRFAGYTYEMDHTRARCVVMRMEAN